MTDPTPAPRAPKGTHDVLWPESTRWEALVAAFARIVEAASYGLTITPVFEDVAVFRRGIGEASEVVGKEMYEFEDRGGRRLALRPEGTAPVVRAFNQHRPPTPWKAWYVTPSFRYEAPQKGRYRQHHQLGVEVLGTEDPDLDAEVITLADRFYRSLGLSSYRLLLNSMGDDTCRPPYLAMLTEALDKVADRLCDEHRTTYTNSPLRVLDCKTDACRAATADVPWLLDHLCDECAAHFARVREGLDALGVGYVIDQRLVRGFDYYTRTTFEFNASTLGATQDAIGGGGRYGKMAEMLGGPPVGGIGFGIGIERVLLVCDAEGVFVLDPPALDAFVVDLTGGRQARDLTDALRRAGLRADRAFDDRSMKSQFRSADRSGARFALIVGPEEADAGTVTIRDLRGEAEQQTLPLEDAVAFVASLREGAPS